MNNNLIKNKEKKIELLSPAKNFEYGKAVIDCGADAVYIGAPEFSARQSAGNSIESIEKLINYGHKFNCQIYIALNTILYDNELQRAEKLIHQLYNIGADALIFQDMSILQMDIPPIPLHASTQCNNFDLEKIQFLEKSGVSRVVLPRELSLTQTKHISDNTSCELETFVHGALCVSFSGQCYMSHYTGSRSGNRGACAQPCRKEYSLFSENGKRLIKDKYLLSLKDMDRSDYIEELIGSGVHSLKIEGRLKDIYYAKNITSFYRKLLDSIISDTSRTSSGRSIFSFSPDKFKTFNRQYCDYFFDGKHKNISAVNSPKSVGKPIGRVTNINRDFITIKSDHELQNGDGICYFTGENKLSGENISSVRDNTFKSKNKNDFFLNQTIFLNHDKSFVKLLDSDPFVRKIDVTLSVEERCDSLRIGVRDEDDNHTFLDYPLPSELSVKGKFSDTLSKNLSKCGNTIFNISAIDLSIDKNYFLPISAINKMRRDILSELESLRIKDFKRVKSAARDGQLPYYKNSLNFSDNVSNELAKDFYQKHGVKSFEPAFELLPKQSQSEKVLMTSKFCVRFANNLCSRNKSENSDLFLKNNKGDNFRLVFDCKNCLMKVYSN